VKHFLIAMLFFLLPAAAFAAEKAEGLEGIWVTEGGKSRVEIRENKKDRYDGAIIWLKEPLIPEGEEDAGKPRMDKNNPDPARRTDPIIGLKVLENFQKTGDNEWKKGTVYDPENGKTYKCRITMEKPDVLHVRGYIGVSWIGRTTVWKRWDPEKEKLEKAQAREEDAS
jgi:uncharacterized protein (DUF2147 family)